MGLYTFRSNKNQTSWEVQVGTGPNVHKNGGRFCGGEGGEVTILGAQGGKTRRTRGGNQGQWFKKLHGTGGTEKIENNQQRKEWGGEERERCKGTLEGKDGDIGGGPGAPTRARQLAVVNWSQRREGSACEKIKVTIGHQVGGRRTGRASGGIEWKHPAQKSKCGQGAYGHRSMHLRPSKNAHWGDPGKRGHHRP